MWVGFILRAPCRDLSHWEPLCEYLQMSPLWLLWHSTAGFDLSARYKQGEGGGSPASQFTDTCFCCGLSTSVLWENSLIPQAGSSYRGYLLGWAERARFLRPQLSTSCLFHFSRLMPQELGKAWCPPQGHHTLRSYALVPMNIARCGNRVSEDVIKII